MRLFVALSLPPGSASELDRMVTPLRPGWPGLRWTGREAWHLTLAFLGEVDEKLAAKLPRRLENAAARHARLCLSLGGAGAFPAPDRARVLWTGVQGDTQGLGKLAETVTGGARRAGVPLLGQEKEQRPYRPHLTLARCRAPADVRPLVEALAGFQGTPWIAEEIYLIRSHLAAHPRYETLGTWPLRTAARRRRGRGQRGGGSRLHV